MFKRRKHKVRVEKVRVENVICAKLKSSQENTRTCTIAYNDIVYSVVLFLINKYFIICFCTCCSQFYIKKEMSKCSVMNAREREITLF